MSKTSRKLKPRLDRLSQALESGELEQARRMLNRGLAPVDVAHLLESSPPKERNLLWELVDAELQGDVLQYLGEDIQTDFLKDMDAVDVLAATENLEPDDVADILQRLPNAVILEVLDSMEAQERLRVETVLSFPEDTAGGLMNTDTITIRPDITLDVVLRYIRRHERLPDSTDTLLVVSRRDEFIGALPINRLLVSDPGVTVREVMDTDSVVIPALMPETEVASLFEKHDLISAPVVGGDGNLLGRITIDDVVDVIRGDAEHQVMSMAGMDEDEDTFSPVMRTSWRRAVWLGINLLTAFMASAVIGMFEGTIQKITALAVLMPIVASMGGIAGSQALTVLIRGIALGHVKSGNVRWLLKREVIVAGLNGLLWAVVVAGIAIVWFGDVQLGAIIGAAIMINLLIAAVTGTLLPVLLKKLNIDPALSGSVILTTVTDVIGFMAFLGLATWLYL
ncbi:MAG: magnesium transporter [Cobetia sp.]|jgi:magnesium transporter|uniref:Magnesium transporter MgtE n=1 Tax=Cobetia amphilecti TaxID=1055104 RepID=A0ABT6ULG5_9GAMM|nr:MULTISPECIES: magnesium transporter [Cobetia]AVV33576.1 magnesium transporter [Halomonas sp. SF2003]MBR9753970.1 magnesium transporter [Gammaproteobacteria bacterium]TCJ25069.1 magnesium transporter [Halomonas sp. GDM18]UTV87187.1 magnesium transporter [Cobetia litoralis]KGA02852.1 magnesium transporter [Cobetia amphilecti]|tara:strand:- start:2401 stop:3756 length:1356 start_codon:yes stop_codon:yes gene_type:complete